MTSQWKEEKAKIKDEGFTATVAQAVHKYLHALEDDRKNRHTRWIWELLQNAHDAATTHDKNLIVSIKYNPEELVFLHNGSGFEKKQIQRLIFHGSTKVEDEETKGQYGSGFLATHLLSPEVDVSGQLDDGKWFDFHLERKPETVEALRKSMNQAWDDFNPSSSLRVSMPSPFTTRFRYPIIEDKHKKAAEAGIKELKRCAPYVVAFNEKFIHIDIKDHDETLSFEVVEHLPLDAVGIQQITVIESKNGKSKEKKYLTAQGEKKTAVTVPLESNRDGSVCLLVEETPRLFSAFPLVGTESFSFPAVINNWDFKSREARDGVPLGQSDNEANLNNQAIIEEACGLLIDLLQFAVSRGWHHVHQWTEIPAIKDKVWLNTEWIRTCIREKFIEKLRKTPIVLNADDNAIDSENVKFLSAGSETSIKAFWDLFEAIKGQRKFLPKQEEAVGWCSAIKSWAEVYQDEPVTLFNEVWDGSKLASSIEKKTRKDGNYGTIQTLEALLRENVSAVEWLNKLHTFFTENGLREVVREYHIVLDQSGCLDKLSELHRDPGIDKELKGIAEKLDWKMRQELRDIRLTSLTEEEGKGDMNQDQVVATLCEKLRARADENPDDDFKAASTGLFTWIVNQEDWKRLKGFPMFTDSSKSNSSPVLHLPSAHTIRPPLAPIRAWAEDLRPFAEIFPPERVLADVFFEALPTLDTWKMLDDEKKLIRWNVIIHRDEMDLKVLSPDPEVYKDDEKDHKATHPISVTDVVELDKILNDVVYDSRNRGYLFWQFLTQWLVNKDTQGLEMVNEGAVCECGEPHEYYPAAWAMLVQKKPWIRDGTPRHLPEAEHLAKLLREKGWELSSLNDNPDVGKLLKAMNVDQSALKRLFIADDVINLAATLSDKPQLVHHMQKNENLPQNLEEILEVTGGDLRQVNKVAQDFKDYPDLFQELEKLKERKHTVAENKRLGEEVEDLVKENLEKEGFKVKRTGIGSDFKIWEDTEDIITLNITQENKCWLVEVKSTRHQSVHMSSKQAETSVKEKEGFLLCVVPLGQENTTSDVVKEKMRFIKNIDESIAPLWEDLEALKEQHANITADAFSDVVLEIEEGQAGIRVNRSVWKNAGIRLEDLIKHLK